MTGTSLLRRIAVVSLLLSTLGAGVRAAAPDRPAPAGDRQAMIVVLSFFSPVGREPRDSYGYLSYRNSGDRRNYPLPLLSLPPQPPAYGSPAYAEVHRRAAATHLQLMKNAAFDTALFDMLPIPDYHPARPLEGLNEPFYLYQSFLPWLRAGEQTGMKVGVFADVANQSARYPKRREIRADEWVNILGGLLDHLPDSPALWKVDGKVGIIHFGTDVFYSPQAAPVSGKMLPDGGWRQVLERVRGQRHQPFFFLADVRPHDRILEWNRIADAVYMFAPAAPASFMSEYQTDISARFTIPYYWFVSPGYYRRGTAYTMPEFRRIHDTYLAAMRSGARRIIVTSWNDMGEDHDIWPSANKGSALLDVFGYYNDWFKRGTKPEITGEKLILCYPLRAPAKITTRSPVWGGGKWVAPPFAPQVSYWALLKKPRTLKIAGAGEVHLSAGLSLGTIGTVKPGSRPDELPVTAETDGRTVQLPPVKVVPAETDGGLQERYLDLLARPLFSLTDPAVKTRWDISRYTGTAVRKNTVPGGGAAMTFTPASGVHNWAYLRGEVPAGAIPGAARLMRLVYRGRIPAGMKLLCVLRQPDNVCYQYDRLPSPVSGTRTEVLVPLNHFVPASWSAATALKIPDATRIGYVNVGAAGRPDATGDGELTLEEVSLLP